MVETPIHFAGSFSDHVLTLAGTGAFRARQTVGAHSIEGWCRSGAVGLVPAHSAVRWDRLGEGGGSRATSLFIPDAFVSRVIDQDWEVEGRRVEILWQFLVRDPVAEGVLSALGFEAEHGSPSGTLYAESACEFLAHHVIRSYSSLSPHRPRTRGGLAAHRLRTVIDYVHDNLAGSMTLRRLAELAGTSPRHFERAFRQAVGMPPHAYVTEARVTAARQLLVVRPRLTMEQIAARVGFSSASHLASAFRRTTGHSPREFRALQSR